MSLPQQTALVTGRRPGRRADDWLTAQLPVTMVEDDLLRRFVSMFQTVADSILDQVDNLGLLLDPAVAPRPMLRYLASWLGEPALDDNIDEVVARRWVGAASELLAWRGTSHGLRTLLELVSGRPVQLVDDGGVFAEGGAPPGGGHVQIRLQRLGALNGDDLVDLVRRELPAHVTFALWVGDTPLWPRQAPPVSPRINEESGRDGNVDLS